MTLCFEVRVACPADLAHVDSRVRALCNTTAGAQCQSLLTTEYQRWRRAVARAVGGAADGACAPDVSDAYLSGLHLCFSARKCVITQSLPQVLTVHASNLRKRKLQTLDVSADQLRPL